MFSIRMDSCTPSDMALRQRTAALLPPASHALLHEAVCDACERLIVGSRFKCLGCADFDLCSECEALHGHEHPASHPFLRLPVPASAAVIAEVWEGDFCRAIRGCIAEGAEPSPPSPVVCSACGGDTVGPGAAALACMTCAHCAYGPACLRCKAAAQAHAAEASHALVYWRCRPVSPAAPPPPLLWCLDAAPPGDGVASAAPSVSSQLLLLRGVSAVAAPVELEWGGVAVRPMTRDDLEGVMQVSWVNWAAAAVAVLPPSSLLAGGAVELLRDVFPTHL